MDPASGGTAAAERFEDKGMEDVALDGKMEGGVADGTSSVFDD